MSETKEYITMPDDRGSINISEDVIAAIAASAVTEVEGVRALSAGGRELMGKKNSVRGVRVYADDASITVNVAILVKLGSAVNETAAAVQSSVISAVESMTGFKVSAVNVNVCGVVLDRE